MLPWVATLALVGAIIAAVALTGGFGRSMPAFVGSPYPVGKPIETRLWDVTVERAEVLNKSGLVLVHILATNKQRISEWDLTPQMLVVLLPNGRAMTLSSCIKEERSAFGPDVQTRAECQFSFEQNEVPAPNAVGLMDIRVVVCDQSMTDALLVASTPQAGEPVGWVGLQAIVDEENS